jgi:hypothetical protein
MDHTDLPEEKTDKLLPLLMDQDIVANIEWILNAAPIIQLDGSEFSKSEIDLITQVDEFFKGFGRKIEREGFGIVNLTRHGIRSSISHGIGRMKAAAFAAVPEIIKHGKIVDHQINWKGRGYDTYVIDAPVTIGNSEFIVEIIIEQNKSKQNKFYLHEVEIKQRVQSTFKTATERSVLQTLEKTQNAFKTATERSALQASRLIITKKLIEIKEKS